ncbi:MAG: hypothetical protein M3P04_00475, partial [Actinomycetota bacterium]|nr:hypothetical protein [Actinomycetota bacterium]
MSSGLEILDEPPAPVAPLPAPPPAAPRRSRLALVLVVLLTLILAGAAALGAAAWNESRPDVYQSQAALLIDQEPAITYAKDERLLVKLGALRVRFADQVRTTTFSQTLSSITGIPSGRIHGALSAQAPPFSLLLRVTARSTDPALPQPVADAAARELSEQLAAQQIELGVPPRARITLTLVSPAQQSALSEPSRRRSAELGLGAFGAVVLAAALLYDLSRRRQPAA